MAYNVSAKPDARREARVPKAKPRSGAAGFACYTPYAVAAGSTPYDAFEPAGRTRRVNNPGQSIADRRSAFRPTGNIELFVYAQNSKSTIRGP